jgi:AcrR family transcriptional regulator
MSKYSQMATRIARKPPATSAEPRKPPNQARARATVNAILDATARILAEEGFEAVNTNRVAEVAGVSVGSLYQYFPNKGSLVGAVAVRHTEAMAAVATPRRWRPSSRAACRPRPTTICLIW